MRRNSVQMAERCREVIAAADPRPFFLYFCPTDPHRSGQVADELPGRPDRFGNRPAGYPGVKDVTYDPKDVLVPHFLARHRRSAGRSWPSTTRSVSRDRSGARAARRDPQGGRQVRRYAHHLSLGQRHPVPRRKTTLYEPGIRLPCVVRSPGQKNRARPLRRDDHLGRPDAHDPRLRRGPARTRRSRLPRPVLPGGPRPVRSQGLGRDLRLAHVPRDHDVLPDARGPRPAVQADLEHRPRAAVPVRLAICGARPRGRTCSAGASKALRASAPSTPTSTAPPSSFTISRPIPAKSTISPPTRNTPRSSTGSRRSSGHSKSRPATRGSSSGSTNDAGGVSQATFDSGWRRPAGTGRC